MHFLNTFTIVTLAAISGAQAFKCTASITPSTYKGYCCNDVGLGHAGTQVGYGCVAAKAAYGKGYVCPAGTWKWHSCCGDLQQSSGPKGAFRYCTYSS